MVEDIKEKVKAFVFEEFLSAENPEELTDSTPLITGGVLDSISTMKLVVFIEEEFHVKIHAHETDLDHMNTISDIANLIQSKLEKE